MLLLGEISAGMASFMDMGGPVLYAILLVTAIMWTLIIERLWYLLRVFPERLRMITPDWQRARDALSDNSDNLANEAKGRWFVRQARRAIVSEARQDARRNLVFIETLMQVLPLLGLLGTVWGMVHVFDIMTIFGTGNARLMASGVSRATIPTMCGLVAALSGLYLIYWLRQRAARVAEQLESHLSIDGEAAAGVHGQGEAND